MKITMDAKVTGSVDIRDMVFLDLKIGDVFLDEDKEIYLRTKGLSTEYEEYNAVELKTGEIVYFDDGDKVWKYEDSVIFNPNAFSNKVVI